MSLVQLFVKVHNEKVEFFLKVHDQKVEFQKAECLVKAVKKYIMKKLSVWLAFIKVGFWGVNYQKGQCIYKGIYFITFFFFLDVSLFHTYEIIYFIYLLNNNNNNKYILLVLF